MTPVWKTTIGWLVGVGGLGGTAVLGLGGYALAQATKVPVLEERVERIEQSTDQRLDRIEQKLDLLIQMHMKDNGNGQKRPERKSHEEK